MADVDLVSFLVCLIEVLDSDESAADGADGAVKHGSARAEFGRVFDHSLLVSVVIGLRCVHGNGLELAPAHREDDRVLRLQNMRVPTMLLDLHSHVRQATLLRLQTAQNKRLAGLQLPAVILL